MVGHSQVTIFRIAPDFPVPGKSYFGLQPAFYHLSREQARLGFNVQVISCARDSDSYAKEMIDGVTVHRVPRPFSISALRLLRDIAQGSADSIIHTHATAGFPMLLFRSELVLPIVSHVHGTTLPKNVFNTSGSPDNFPKSMLAKTLYSYLREKIFWSRANRLVAVSEGIKEDLVHWYGIPRTMTSVVLNGVDENLFRPITTPVPPPNLPRPLTNNKIVLYVGHFGLRKGVGHLIQAMKRVVSEVPEAALLCIGGVPKWLGDPIPYWSYLRFLIHKNQLEDKVFLLDHVPNAELPKYYSLSSIFVLPSYYEGFSKVVLEAMACEKPIVISRTVGAESIEDESSGILVDYGSVDAIASAVIRLLQDDGLRRKMGMRARMRVQRDFTWNAVAKRISASYEEVLK